MKNKTVKMVLAVVVLGVCCGAYAGVKTYVAHQEQKESEEDSEESTTVFTALTDNIKSLDFMVDDTETTFEKDDMLRIPFIKVDDEINYDELCGKEIKNSKYYIKQALQTIDFELNNVGGSVKSEAVIDATTKALTENARKMIFDSDFILYLKEENKDQPYLALKVDNTDVLVSVNVDECKD